MAAVMVTFAGCSGVDCKNYRDVVPASRRPVPRAASSSQERSPSLHRSCRCREKVTRAWHTTCTRVRSIIRRSLASGLSRRSSTRPDDDSLAPQRQPFYNYAPRYGDRIMTLEPSPTPHPGTPQDELAGALGPGVVLLGPGAGVRFADPRALE